jgi:hypothetical protein
MKKTHAIFGFLFLCAGHLIAEKTTLKAGHFEMDLNEKGRIIRLTDDRSKTPDFIHSTRATSLPVGCCFCCTF